MERHLLRLEDSKSDQVLKELGRQIRTLRLRQNLDQITLAERAGIALTALKNLEGGHGATLTTFVKTLQVLGRLEWLATLSPTVSISPLQMLKTKPERLRASRPKPRRAKL